MFLPPYSPDLNPMEEAFSYINSYLRQHEAVPNPQDIIRSAFYFIAGKHCQSTTVDTTLVNNNNNKQYFTFILYKPEYAI